MPDKLDGEDAAKTVEDQLMKPGEKSPGRTPQGTDHEAREEPDVYLDVPQLKLDELILEVDRLEARIALHATVAQLVQLDVGAEASVDRVNLTIRGVEARAALKVRLDHVYAIIDRALTTLDSHPEMLKAIAEPAARSLEQLGGAAERTVGSGLLPEVARSLESATDQAAQGGGRAARGILGVDGRDSQSQASADRPRTAGGADSAVRQVPGDPLQPRVSDRPGAQDRAALESGLQPSTSGAAQRSARSAISSGRSPRAAAHPPSSDPVRPLEDGKRAAEKARPGEQRPEGTAEHAKPEGPMTEETKTAAQRQQAGRATRDGAREELRRVIEALSKELDGLRRLDAGWDEEVAQLADERRPVAEGASQQDEAALNQAVQSGSEGREKIELLDDTAESFGRWKFVGAGSIEQQGSELRFQAGDGLGLAYFEARRFDDLELRFQFRPDSSDTELSAAVRFLDPEKPVPDRNDSSIQYQYDNQAYVAVHTGLEVHLGAQRSDARPGAFYGVPPGEADGAQSTPDNAELRSLEWNDVKLSVRGDHYSVWLNGKETARFTNVDTFRGKPAATGAHAGFVGFVVRSGSGALHRLEADLIASAEQPRSDDRTQPSQNL